MVDKTHLCIARKVFAVEFAYDLNVSDVTAVVLSPSVVWTQIQSGFVTAALDVVHPDAVASPVVRLNSLL